jgi:long-chain acyl-CoA synthetase
VHLEPDACSGRAEPASFASGHGRTIAWLSREFVRSLHAVELSPPQYRILVLLSDGSAMSSSLATRLAVSPPSVTSVVDGLVNRGLVERRHGEDDRRRVALALTEAGVGVLARADEQLDAMAAELAANLPVPEQRADALGALDLWSEALVVLHRAKAAAKASSAAKSAAAAAPPEGSEAPARSDSSSAAR